MTSITAFFPLAVPLWRFQHSTATMKQKSEQRLTEIVGNHGSFIARTLRNLGVTGGELDDCVQKVFIVAARRIGDIELGKEKAFLFRCAQNTAAHYRRSLARKREVSDDDLAERFDPELQPDVISERKRHRKLLDQVLAKMDDSLRVVLVLHAFEEMTMAEIASLLDIPAGTVASRLRRARATFKHEVLAIEASSQQEIA
jgi:RNA polymerase sigma-70 factor (ECF subfamily)